MAKKKHRKLFPMLASEKKETLDCSLGVCDTICPYNCYSEPDYHTIPPWSSPRPSRAPSPSISAIYQPSQNASPSINSMGIITVTGAALVILLTGFFLVVKFVLNSPVNNLESANGYHTEEEEFQDREQVDHPIWFIRTTGLQQSVINSITICNYKRGDGLIERTDCPVCLNEFEDDESLRLLPKCNHAFHVSCIDTWLRSHTNCPLCRAGITISSVTSRISGPVTPGVSESRLENNEEDQDREQIENRVEVERESDEYGVKETLSSSYRDSDNTETSSDVIIEVSCVGDGSETETKEKLRVLEECMDQGFTREETEEEKRASCSGDEGGKKDQSGRGYDSIHSGESSGEVIEITGSSSVSFFNTNKSSVFPMS